MENKNISIAIHREAKANMMREILEKNGIPVFLEQIPSETLSFSIDIPGKYIGKALDIIENNRFFDYDKKTSNNDDGIKRILVPIDFSEDSLKACRFAFGIAESLKAKVKIIHVFDEISYPIQGPYIGMIDKKEVIDFLSIPRKKMLELCNNIDKEISEGILPSINFSYALRKGVVVAEIESFIEEYNPSLIVMGTRGTGYNMEKSLGSSVSSELIETTNIPVIAISNTSVISSINDIKHAVYLVNEIDKVMTPEDFNPFLHFNSLSKITIVHINIQGKSVIWRDDDGQNQKEILQKIYPQLNVEYQILNSETVIDGLNVLSKNMDSDITVLNTKKRNIWKLMFNQSLARKVISNINTAIMILRN